MVELGARVKPSPVRRVTAWAKGAGDGAAKCTRERDGGATTREARRLTPVERARWQAGCESPEKSAGVVVVPIIDVMKIPAGGCRMMRREEMTVTEMVTQPPLPLPVKCRHRYRGLGSRLRTCRSWD